eukprot:6198475-Pleurochrysis_carterae.AAC.1
MAAHTPPSSWQRIHRHRLGSAYTAIVMTDHGCQAPKSPMQAGREWTYTKQPRFKSKPIPISQQKQQEREQPLWC